MKKIFLALPLSFGILLNFVRAKSGCCSSHGGTSYCSNSGIQVCNDGNYSPTCTCSIPKSNTENAKKVSKIKNAKIAVKKTTKKAATIKSSTKKVYVKGYTKNKK